MTPSELIAAVNQLREEAAAEPPPDSEAADSGPSTSDESVS
jgi:hypothetical protein